MVVQCDSEETFLNVTTICCSCSRVHPNRNQGIEANKLRDDNKLGGKCLICWRVQLSGQFQQAGSDTNLTKFNYSKGKFIVLDLGQIHTVCIIRRAARKLKGAIIPLCSAPVRLHLQYCVLSCVPQRKTDFEILEKAQWRATIKGVQKR